MSPSFSSRQDARRQGALLPPAPLPSCSLYYSSSGIREIRFRSPLLLPRPFLCCPFSGPVTFPPSWKFKELPACTRAAPFFWTMHPIVNRSHSPLVVFLFCWCVHGTAETLYSVTELPDTQTTQKLTRKRPINDLINCEKVIFFRVSPGGKW